MSSGILCAFHHALDRLLEDDDEALRNGASEIVRKALGISSPICRDRADELWCDWVAEYLSTLGSEDAKPWIDWLQAEADQDDIHDVHRGGGHSTTQSSPSPLAPIQPGGTTLFTVEPANLFRDPHADAQRAKAILDSANRRRL